MNVLFSGELKNVDVYMKIYSSSFLHSLPLVSNTFFFIANIHMFFNNNTFFPLCFKI